LKFLKKISPENARESTDVSDEESGIEPESNDNDTENPAELDQLSICESFKLRVYAQLSVKLNDNLVWMHKQNATRSVIIKKSIHYIIIIND
jgi:hypothetical protein